MRPSPEGHDWFENQIAITMDLRDGPVIGWLHTTPDQMTVGCADCPWYATVANPEHAIDTLQQHRSDCEGH